MELLISESFAGGGPHIIEAEGEIDIASVGRLETVLHDAINAGRRPLLLDLGRCAYMDSTGLRAVLSAHNALRVNGEVNGASPPLFAVATRQPAMLKLFELTRLDETIPIVPTREAGVALLGGTVEGHLT